MNKQAIKQVIEYLKELKLSGIPNVLQAHIEDAYKTDILAENPGTGKIHIAIGLGIEACNVGYKVLFSGTNSIKIMGHFQVLS